MINKEEKILEVVLKNCTKKIKIILIVNYIIVGIYYGEFIFIKSNLIILLIFLIYYDS